MIQNKSEFQGHTTPKRVWDIFINTLIKPKKTLENTRFQWKEALVYLIVFLVLSLANDQVQSLTYLGVEFWRETLLSSVFTAVYIWIFLSLMFQVAALIFGGKENIFTMLGSMGYTIIPLIPITLIELVFAILIWQGVFPMDGALANYVPRVLSWIGTAWAWPGLLCLFMLQNIYKFGYRKAAGVMAVVWVIVIFSWFLPHA